MADGLECLHDLGIVHGDLRGTNVLIDDNWHVRLTDFGLAILADASTQTAGIIAGFIPLAWAAPELLDESSKRPTFATDVFSFARTCVEVRDFESQLRSQRSSFVTLRSIEGRTHLAA